MPTILGIASLFLLATDVLHWDLSHHAGRVGEEPHHLSHRGDPRAAHGGRPQLDHGGGPDAGRVHRADRLRHRHVAGRRDCSSSTRTTTSSRAASSSRAGCIDYYIFFLVFLFGVQTAEDALKVIKGLLLRRAARQPHHDSRRRRHHQPRFPDPRRRPHRGRHRRVQSVRGVHHPVPAGDDRRGRGGRMASGGCSGLAPRWSAA